MILETTNGVHKDKDVDDLYGDPFAARLHVAATRLEHAPYHAEGEKSPTRLMRAMELVRLSRVQLHDERLATVHGSTRPYDLTGFHCTCPQSQKGQSRWCVHAVAVKLARTMAEERPREESLPLPPVTVEERLAQAAEHQESPTMPQEDRMSEIPEPEEHVPPVAILDAPERKEERKESPRPLPGPVLLPSLDARTLEQSMQAYAAQRQVVTRYIKEQMSEGVDYYTLTIKGRVSKATLSKAGSEKFLSLFQLHAAFQQDQATWQMLGSKEGLLCYTCTLMTRSGEVIGEGRGARSVTQDGGDINKAIKMATKSAQVDAVLRTGALSDVFTQDLEPETPPVAGTPEGPVKAAAAPSADLRKRIWAQVNAQAPHVKTQDEAKAWVQERTGLPMEPDHYAKIVAALEAHV